jgi:hypothetical protein
MEGVAVEQWFWLVIAVWLFFLFLATCLEKTRKPLLILDINKLLVCRAFKPKMQDEFPSHMGYIKDATLLGQHYTWKRPYLDAFLEYAFQHYDIAIWSSAWRENVDKLCDFIFTPEQRSRLVFEWDQTKCDAVEPHPDPSERKPLFEKPLKRVWKEFPEYNRHNTLIFDDSQLKMRNNPPECVYQPNSWIVTQTEDYELSPEGGKIFKQLN